MAVRGPGDGAGRRGPRALLLGPLGLRELGLLALIPLLALPFTGCDENGGPDGSASFHGRYARVTEVRDGDTLRLAGLGPVRLIGIDTPEVYGEEECFGREASDFAKHLLPLGTRVRYRVGTEGRDRYRRLLAYVWLPDHRMLNRVMVQSGHARPLTIPPNVDFDRVFRAAARAARRAGLGLWQACGTGG